MIEGVVFHSGAKPRESLYWFAEKLQRALLKRDIKAYQDLAQPLATLASDHEIIVDAINVQLRRMLFTNKAYDFNAIPIALFPGGVTLRAVVWNPPQLVREAKPDDEMLLDTRLHNHVVHLLSVAVTGPGYRTDIFRLSQKHYSATIGESVDLCDHREVHLAKGQTIFYEAFSDVHIQRYPDETSITLNVLIPDDRSAVYQQLFLEDNSYAVVPPAYPKRSLVPILAPLMRQFKCNHVSDLVSELSENHPNAAVREAFATELRTFALEESRFAAQ